MVHTLVKEMSNITANTIHQFLIFRHGIATKDPAGYGEAILSAPLLDEGIPSMEKLSLYLREQPSDFHFSSELLRCRQTVEIVQRITGKVFQFDPRLNEYHQEPFQQFSDRVNSFLEDVIEKADRFKQTHPAAEGPVTIVICTHGAVIAAMKHLLLDGTFHQENELDYTQPGELLKIWKKSIELKIFN